MMGTLDAKIAQRKKQFEAEQAAAKAAATKPAARPAAVPREDLGKQAADVYTGAVQIAGAAPMTVPGRKAARIAETMIARVVAKE